MVRKVPQRRQDRLQRVFDRADHGGAGQHRDGADFAQRLLDDRVGAPGQVPEDGGRDLEAAGRERKGLLEGLLMN